MPAKYLADEAKNHTVSFRISIAEFQLLKALQPLHGARSFSDFARDTLLRELAAATEKPRRPEGARDLSTRINILQRDLEKLRAMIPDGEF